MIITTELITIDKDRNLKDAFHLMEKKHISRLLVTEKGKIVGIITEGDIANRLGTGKERKLKTEHIHVSGAMTKNLEVMDIKLAEMRVSSTMTQNMQFISGKDGIIEAARIMLENGFSSLPIQEDGNIIGIVTKTDLIKTLKESQKFVRDYYTTSPILTAPNASLVSARKLMLENGIHRLLVTDRGMLAGILTERDIANGLKTFRKAIDKYPQADIKRLKVEDVMNLDPITIKPETTIGEATGIMLEKRISGLPVIAQEFGILTKTDLVRGIAKGRLH